ncbi:hypothetical protein RJT34_23873 [Clitoria ternatea]|uniref:Uncharacterized protein n=1 Tax=Clitoria ternatea TaxID=43366 RepID=A0AAN9FT30_CLITE
MGNGNSTVSKGAKVTSTEQQRYAVVPKQRKVLTKAEPEVVGLETQPEEHGKKQALYNDDTFTSYIQRAKYKIRSMSHIGRHGEHNNPAPADVVNGSHKKENGSDQFSEFIHNAKKKIRTVSRKNSSFRKG